MNAIKIMGAALLLLFVLNLVSLFMLLRLNRVQGDAGTPHRPSAAAEFLMRELQFNPEQRHAYMNLIQEHRQQIRKLDKVRGDLRHRLFAGIAQNDTSALQGLREVEGRFELLTFRHFQAVRKLATPSQQSRFDQIIQEVMLRMAPPARRHPKARRHG